MRGGTLGKRYVIEARALGQSFYAFGSAPRVAMQRAGAHLWSTMPRFGQSLDVTFTLIEAPHKFEYGGVRYRGEERCAICNEAHA